MTHELGAAIIDINQLVEMKISIKFTLPVKWNDLI